MKITSLINIKLFIGISKIYIDILKSNTRYTYARLVVLNISFFVFHFIYIFVV